MWDIHLGFIGAGQMATALAKGIVAAKLLPAKHIIAGDPVENARENFASAVPGCRLSADNAEVVRLSDVVVLAVKPAAMPAALSDVQPSVSASKLFISIAAGVRLAALQRGLGSEARVIRVMPNTPCLIGKGTSAFALGENVSATQGQTAEQILAAVGQAYRVEEKLLDAVTGLSGSGPAFVFTVIEALSDGGVLMGLPRDMATAMAAHTVLGAAELVVATAEHPAKLRDQVTSPAGTTIAGLAALESGGLRSLLIEAVRCAATRSAELGRE